MVQGERPSRDRRSDSDQRRDQREPEWTPPSRRPRTDDDDFGLPAWGGTGGSSPERRGDRGSPRGESAASRLRTGRNQRDPLPQLGDAFGNPRVRVEGEDNRSAASTRDPYERLRRVPSQPARRVQFDDRSEFGASSTYLPEYEDDYDALPPVPREEVQRLRRRQPAPERRAPATNRPKPALQLGGLFAAAPPQVRSLASIGAVDLVSLALMAVALAVRLGSRPDWIPVHLDAAGAPDLWGTRSTLWEIPLMALMLTVMSAAVAWYLSKRDLFAARFVMLSTVLIQVLAWIGLAHLLR